MLIRSLFLSTDGYYPNSPVVRLLVCRSLLIIIGVFHKLDRAVHHNSRHTYIYAWKICTEKSFGTLTCLMQWSFYMHFSHQDTFYLTSHSHVNVYGNSGALWLARILADRLQVATGFMPSSVSLRSSSSDFSTLWILTSRLMRSFLTKMQTPVRTNTTCICYGPSTLKTSVSWSIAKCIRITIL